MVESRVINEYVEEAAPGRKLLPSDPLERAWARIWNGYCDEEIMKHLRTAAAAEPATQQRALEELDVGFARLETHLFVHAQPGAFWGGQEPSLTDICYWSLFDVLERVDVLLPARQRRPSPHRRVEPQRTRLPCVSARRFPAWSGLSSGGRN